MTFLSYNFGKLHKNNPLTCSLSKMKPGNQLAVVLYFLSIMLVNISFSKFLQNYNMPFKDRNIKAKNKLLVTVFDAYFGLEVKARNISIRKWLGLGLFKIIFLCMSISFSESLFAITVFANFLFKELHSISTTFFIY